METIEHRFMETINHKFICDDIESLIKKVNVLKSREYFFHRFHVQHLLHVTIILAELRTDHYFIPICIPLKNISFLEEIGESLRRDWLKDIKNIREGTVGSEIQTFQEVQDLLEEEHVKKKRRWIHETK